MQSRPLLARDTSSQLPKGGSSVLKAFPGLGEGRAEDSGSSLGVSWPPTPQRHSQAQARPLHRGGQPRAWLHWGGAEAGSAYSKKVPGTEGWVVAAAWEPRVGQACLRASQKSARHLLVYRPGRANLCPHAYLLPLGSPQAAALAFQPLCAVPGPLHVCFSLPAMPSSLLLS